MSYKQEQHDFITQFQKLSIELNRKPTAQEFINSIVGGREKLRSAFDNWDNFLKIAKANIEPIKPLPDYIKLIKRYKSICSHIEQLQAFKVHILDLEELFERAGNPPSLRLSGMPDTHVKFMDKPAVMSYLKFLEWYNPDIHLIFGDFADCEGISHWPSNDLEPRRLIPEMIQARQLLENIIKLTPKVSTRIFLTGNHEDWIEKGLSSMPELFEGIEQLGIDISVKSLLNLNKYEYQLFPVNDLIRIGKAHFTHGIYTAQAHAKKHMSVYKCNIYYGHLHDNQVYNETSIYGNLEAACNGCLSKLNAKFLRGKPNNWVHGHGAWEFFRDGSYTRYFIPIFNGKSSMAGNIFDGNNPINGLNL